MRLDKFLSHARGMTRSEASRTIRRCVVTVNGTPTRDTATHVDPDSDEVALDGDVITHLRRVVLMMHKPAGVICATEDPAERTVFDLLPESFRRPDLRIVGRLDKDATGLLLMTTDGELLHRLTHPNRETPKTYRVELEEPLPDAPARFAAGIELEDGSVCRPGLFESVGGRTALITISEGKYHQVKRMVAACFGHVTALHRERVGPIRLDPALPSGGVRLLDAAELAALDKP